MQTPFLIRVDWDEDSSVWTADSDDIPGLATEAETLEGLSLKLERMIPELVALNSVESSDPISYELLIRRFASVRRQAA
jgi:predicted RNase H-like HicB family nuclease